MIRLGKLTDYGVMLMTVIARDRKRTIHTARELAAVSRLPLPTVSKVLKVLLHGHLLNSERGIKGGYTLARDPQEITMAEMIAVLEGPISLTECSTDLSAGQCDLERCCPIKSNQRIINQVVHAALAKVTLSDLSQPLNLITIKDARGNLASTISLDSVNTPSGRMQ